MKRPYKVEVVVTETHVFHVPDCNTSDEAESIAEAYFFEGEEGEVTEQTVESIDAVPEEDDESQG